MRCSGFAATSAVCLASIEIHQRVHLPRLNVPQQRRPRARGASWRHTLGSRLLGRGASRTRGTCLRAWLGRR